MNILYDVLRVCTNVLLISLSGFTKLHQAPPSSTCSTWHYLAPHAPLGTTRLHQLHKYKHIMIGFDSDKRVVL